MDNFFTIGYEIPAKLADYIGFSSKASLMDADFVIFSPQSPVGYPSSYQGKSSFDESSSFRYQDHIAHWKKELMSILLAGKTVFIFLNEKENFFLKTGGTEIKGKVTMNYVSEHHNYEFLPVDIGAITTAKGKGVHFSGESSFAQFYKTFKNNLVHEVYIENNESAKIIFTGKDKTKILGAIYKVGTGNMVVLPYLEYDEKDFTETKNDSKGVPEEYWTKEAVNFGDNLISSLSLINKNLSGIGTKTPPPDWVLDKKFNTKEELIIQAKIEKNKAIIKNAEDSNNILESQLDEEQVLKALLFEQSKPLENAVITALRILGYQAENYDDGTLELDQVIISPEGGRYVGECEGKDNKDIDITKFRQLMESLSADFDREEVEEKAFGILFGNPQRLLPVESRTLDFTNKCKIGAKREKIALVKTSDLFDVAKIIKETNDLVYQKKCRDAIHSGLGRVVEFPKHKKKKK